ncbi:MAG: NADH-quinone oxidoreductase subunit H [Gemmatimonadota bacterium]|nr:MAG: NADH-quinone oxidoreductase subunit H [Gemmatimonadota bacterium]
MSPIGGGAFVVATLIKVVVFFTLLMLSIALGTYVERRLAAFIQDRSGPNRVGPIGLLQVVADGLKNLLKEETLPVAAYKGFFLLAPAMALIPGTILFAVIPFAAPAPTRWGYVEMLVADVPIGVLYVLAIASLGVYGVVMAGWSSGSKYAFLGGLRGSAQMVSYEVGLALSLVPVLMLTGDVRVPEMVALQQYYPGGSTLGVWLVFPLLVGAFLFYVTSLAETNRLPFDLPEAEAELVAGYHTEYSSMKFSAFMLGEYGHLITTAGLVTVFFLGGWDIPFWRGDNVRVAADGSLIGQASWLTTLLTLVAFTVKGSLVFATFIWIRWTLPRFRYDQLMDLGWKFILEFVTVYILVIALAIYIFDRSNLPFGPAYAAALFGVNVLLAILLFFVLDRGRLIRGASRVGEAEARRRLLQARARRRGEALTRATAERGLPARLAEDAERGGG